MEFKDVYELMRAYKDSNLLVNKRLIGGRVSEFLDIPKSYRQVIRDDKGSETLYQFFEFKLPQRLKRERAIERYLKKLERKFEDKLLPISDEEIEHFNEYWDLDFIGKTVEFKDKNSVMIINPKGKRFYFSLEEGKELNDAFQIMFKPLPYTGGEI